MLGIHSVRRLVPAISVVAVLFLLVASLTRHTNLTDFSHAKSTTETHASGANANDGLDFCRSHGFDPYLTKTERPRRVYDLFMVSTELDWLEIRLNTLAPYVDYFVIVEGDTTFTGIPKPLYLQDNWDKFSKFHDQIIHVVVPDPGSSLGMRTWDHEDYLRNALMQHTFPTVAGTQREVQDGDVLVVSDVDEIPRPQTMDALRQCTFPERLTLRSSFYYYSFQWEHVGKQWAHPQATVYHGMDATILPNDLRNGIGGPSDSWVPFLSAWRRWRQKGNMWSAAWHCSSCFSTLDEMLTKMRSFSHTSLNTAENRDAETIVNRVRQGLDLFGRWGQNYARVDANQDVPSYVLQNPAQYKYMLDRDGPDAGFTDWQDHLRPQDTRV